MSNTETTLSDNIKSTLQKWKEESQKENKPLHIFLGVDIGGTNTRVAAIKSGNSNNDATSIEESYILVSKFKSSSLKDLVSSLKVVGEQFVSITGTKPITACLDVAGPISDKGCKVSITNYVGENVLHVKDLPEVLFPAGKTIFINDLASTCEGINFLNQQNQIQEFFGVLWGNEVKHELKPVNYLVLAMGTGLGCGLLNYTSSGHEVVALETGHTTLSPLGPSHPEYKDEQSLLQFLSNKIYNNQHSPEWEDICSGRGLVSCYEWASRKNPNASKGLQSIDVVKLAMENKDEEAQKALLLHYKYLFRSAQQQSIAFQCKGVFLAGDNQVYNDPFVVQHVNQFKAEFLNHPKQHWISESAVYRQTKSYNLNLLGCLFRASRMH